MHTLHSSCFHVSLCICIVHHVHVSSCKLPLGVLFLGLGRSYTLQNVHYSTMSPLSLPKTFKFRPIFPIVDVVDVEAIAMDLEWDVF